MRYATLSACICLALYGTVVSLALRPPTVLELLSLRVARDGASR